MVAALRVRLALAGLAIAGCGGAAIAAETPDDAEPDAAAPVALARLAPPGSGLSLDAPATLSRIPHTLGYVDADREMTVVVSDVQVEPGTEPAVAEAFAARIRNDTDADVRMRPMSLGVAGGVAEGVELTVNGESERLRVVTVWRGGRIGQLLVRAPVDDARLVERMIDSLRFDSEAPIDPLAALDVALSIPDGMHVLSATNEELVLSEDREVAGLLEVRFPSATAALDVTYVAFRQGERPSDPRAQGRLLGMRFRGLSLAPPEVTPVAGAALAGTQLSTAVHVDGAELYLYGAYLDVDGGALLVRASVDAARADTWRPRFEAVARSLRPR